MEPEHRDIADPTRRSLLAVLGGLALAAPSGAQSKQDESKRGKKDKQVKKKGGKPKPPRVIVLAHVTEVRFTQGSISVSTDAVGRATSAGAESFGVPTVGASFPLGSKLPPAKAMRAKLVEQVRLATVPIVPGPLETIAVILL